MATKLLAAQVSIHSRMIMEVLFLTILLLTGMSLLQNKPLVVLMSYLKAAMDQVKKAITLYGQQILLA